MKDAVGYELSGGDARALDRLELAFHQYRCFADDPLETVDAALQLAPDLVMGHALRAWLMLASADGHAVPLARQSLQSAAALPHNEREAMHLKAIGQWCAGQWRAAALTLEDLSLAYPLDSLALKAGHALDYFTGDARMLHDRIARALPAWSAGVPGWHSVLSMWAFGLEENGHYAQAEKLGRQAVELQPRDAWGQHAVAHVMEMQGRRSEGIAWMTQNSGWQEQSPLGVHNWWHLALQHLALGDTARVLALFDSRIRRPEAAFQLELIDASSMLWRLRLAGVDVGDRWNHVADQWAPNAGLGWCAFNDWHAAMAFVSAGREDALLTLAAAQAEALSRTDDAARFLGEVGLAATQGVVAYGRGDFARAVELLRPVRSRSHAFGGSVAQRDLLDLTLIDAARRAGQSALADALVQERQVRADQRH
jgi:tetratricopeptide (TPR) repeat protein